MAAQLMIPERVVFGDNALEAAADTIKGYGKKALVVSGANVKRHGILNVLTEHLDRWNLDYITYILAAGEPTTDMVHEGKELFLKNGCDMVIAIGGGSPLDAAKAIAASSKLSGSLSDYVGREIKGDFPPMIMIPTTAGTGSETTKFTIITDPLRNVKMLLKGEDLLPNLAIINAEFTLSAPKEITAQTGIDALTHAVEAYTSRRANVFTDLYALSAIKRIFTYLPIAYRDGENKTAREEMAMAAFEAGVCINNASVTIVHGMSRPIGALFHVPHGLSNAMLIKDALEYVLDGASDRFAMIARAINACDYRVSDKEAAGIFLRELGLLLKHCEIPTLQEYGIDKKDFEAVMDKMAEDAMASGSPSNTMKEVTKEDLQQIYKKLYD